MKLTLDVSYDYQFLLLGIICNSRDYRLGWFLNNYLDMSLERQEDLEATHKKKHSQHAYLSFNDDENRISYHLIQNKTSQGIYIPETRDADFLLKIEDEGALLVSELIKKLRAVPLIQAVFEIEVDELKNKELLIF
jgi:hypothetical protein